MSVSKQTIHVLEACRVNFEQDPDGDYLPSAVLVQNATDDACLTVDEALEKGEIDEDVANELRVLDSYRDSVDGDVLFEALIELTQGDRDDEDETNDDGAW